MSLHISTRKRNANTTSSICRELAKHKDSNSFVLVTYDPDQIDKRIFELSERLYSVLPLRYSVCCIKDLISNTDSVVSGGSKFLSEYTPPFNASTYLSLKRAGAVNVANATLDEFGLGGTGLSCYYGIVPNPVNPEYITGGSSSGSGYLVKKELIDFSIVSDTGDSARNPASFCGVYGFKPTFGSISRYGFYPFCSGFDTPSIMASSLGTLMVVFTTLSSVDPCDLCTYCISRNNQELIKSVSLQNLRIVILKGTFNGCNNSEIRERFNVFIDGLRKDGCKVEEYEFPEHLLRLSNLIYFIVSSVESISNYSNLTGLLFPFKQEGKQVDPIHKRNGSNYEEILKNNRSVLGSEFVFRQVMGMHFLNGKNYEEVYLRSKKILSIFNREIDKLFESFDIVISPTSSDLPPKISDYKRQYKSSNIENIRLLGNFCSLPSISIPWIEVQGMPIGLHLMSKFNTDLFLLSVAKSFSKWIDDGK